MLRAGAHGGGRVMAGGFEYFERFVAEIGLAGGEESEGLQSHGAHGDAVFGEAGADEGEQSPALRVGRRTDGSRDQDITACLPFFHGESGGGFREEVAVRGEDAGLALADEAGKLGGAAMVGGIVRAEPANQLADGGSARTIEEVSGSGSRIAGPPRDCGSSGTRFAPFAGWSDCGHAGL